MLLKSILEALTFIGIMVALFLTLYIIFELAYYITHKKPPV